MLASVDGHAIKIFSHENTSRDHRRCPSGSHRRLCHISAVQLPAATRLPLRPSQTGRRFGHSEPSDLRQPRPPERSSGGKVTRHGRPEAEKTDPE